MDIDQEVLKITGFSSTFYVDNGYIQLSIRTVPNGDGFERIVKIKTQTTEIDLKEHEFIGLMKFGESAVPYLKNFA